MTITTNSCHMCLKPGPHYISVNITLSEDITISGYYCTEHLKQRVKQIHDYLDKPHVIKECVKIEPKR